MYFKLFFVHTCFLLALPEIQNTSIVNLSSEIWPNSARNLAEAEFGRILEKWPNFEFAEAEIRCNPTSEYSCFLSPGNIYNCLSFIYYSQSLLVLLLW